MLQVYPLVNDIFFAPFDNLLEMDQDSSESDSSLDFSSASLLHSPRNSSNDNQLSGGFDRSLNSIELILPPQEALWEELTYDEHLISTLDAAHRSISAFSNQTTRRGHWNSEEDRQLQLLSLPPQWQPETLEKVSAQLAQREMEGAKKAQQQQQQHESDHWRQTEENLKRPSTVQRREEHASNFESLISTGTKVGTSSFVLNTTNERDTKRLRTDTEDKYTPSDGAEAAATPWKRPQHRWTQFVAKEIEQHHSVSHNPHSKMPYQNPLMSGDNEATPSSPESFSALLQETKTKAHFEQEMQPSPRGVAKSEQSTLLRIEEGGGERAVREVSHIPLSSLLLGGLPVPFSSSLLSAGLNVPFVDPTSSFNSNILPDNSQNLISTTPIAESPKLTTHSSDSFHRDFTQVSINPTTNEDTSVPLQEYNWNSPNSVLGGAPLPRPTGQQRVLVHKFSTKVHLTPYLTMPQKEAASMLGLSQGGLSKRWQIISKGAPWPNRAIRRIDKEILSLKMAIKRTNFKAEVESAQIRIEQLHAKRKALLPQCYIKL